MMTHKYRGFLTGYKCCFTWSDSVDESDPEPSLNTRVPFLIENILSVTF